MASPATATWWSTFLDAQGRSGEEEAGFNGFLTTNNISPDAGPDVLQEAYAHFRQWMQESEDREADRGPDRATLAAQQAVIALEQQFVAKSWLSAPGVEKPTTAATRPKESREPLAEGGPGPEGEAQVASASATPLHQAASPSEGSESPSSRAGRSRGSEG
jgi:hypothetical protein